MLSDISPEIVTGYSNVPRAPLPLLPRLTSPEAVGRAQLAISSRAGLAHVAVRLGATPITLMLVLLSPPVVHGGLHRNLDWPAALRFVLPPVVGLFFIAGKPQGGIAGAILRLFEAASGEREIVAVFAPFVIAWPHPWL